MSCANLFDTRASYSLHCACMPLSHDCKSTTTISPKGHVFIAPSTNTRPCLLPCIPTCTHTRARRHKYIPSRGCKRPRWTTSKSTHTACACAGNAPVNSLVSLEQPDRRAGPPPAWAARVPMAGAGFCLESYPTSPITAKNLAGSASRCAAAPAISAKMPQLNAHRKSLLGPAA